MLPGKSQEIILIVTLVGFLFNISWVMSPVKVKESHKGGNKNLQVFILAGQSNMAGNGGVHRQIENGVVTNLSWDGFVPQECKPNPKILRFNAAEKWERAHEPLNYGIDCLRACGLGPGMAFANEILKKDPEFGVIGLVPCAKGGTPLHKWRRGFSPYDSLIRRAKLAVKNGGTIRALFWYHGESDGKAKNTSSLYKKNLDNFFQDLRSDLHAPTLPIFEVIIPYPKEPFVGPYIEEVRAAQLGINLSNVIKIDAEGLELGPDGLHITTPAQVQLGHIFAHAFLRFNNFPFLNRYVLPFNIFS
ncbi:PREDICTED: probable carbohydrate esterase At4g34215 [Nicotiana attenuata]|uniref:probable carbohydrate esterase At4g34215 n=1 Tax=Nicotiana attenuata TaxID=49451 RepID=UPI000905B048|nr:PREDICTED: probable carbohydrate esterase At4g34215 [Nicotiana attenuata]